MSPINLFTSQFIFLFYIIFLGWGRTVTYLKQKLHITNTLRPSFLLNAMIGRMYITYVLLFVW